MLFTYSHLVWSRGTICDRVVFRNTFRHNHARFITLCKLGTIQSWNGEINRVSVPHLMLPGELLQRSGKFKQLVTPSKILRRSKSTEGNLILLLFLLTASKHVFEMWAAMARSPYQTLALLHFCREPSRRTR